MELIVGQVVVTNIMEPLPAGTNTIGKVALEAGDALIGRVKIDPNYNKVKIAEFDPAASLPEGYDHIGEVTISNAVLDIKAEDGKTLPVRETFAAAEFLTLNSTGTPVSQAFAQAVYQVMLIADANCRVNFNGAAAAAGLRMLRGEAVTLPLTVTSVTMQGDGGSASLRVVGLR